MSINYRYSATNTTFILIIIVYYNKLVLLQVPRALYTLYPITSTGKQFSEAW